MLSFAAMKIAAIATILYAFLVALGGVMGYVQARSIPSLVSGLVFGIILLVCGWLSWQGSVTASYGSAVLIILLALFFGYRFLTTSKFVPGGLMLICSFLALFFILLGVFLRAKQ